MARAKKRRRSGLGYPSKTHTLQATRALEEAEGAAQSSLRDIANGQCATAFSNIVYAEELYGRGRAHQISTTRKDRFILPGGVHRKIEQAIDLFSARCIRKKGE